MKVIPDGASTIDIGVTGAKPTISLIDYSRRETDDFGVTTVVRRGFALQMSVRIKVDTDQVDAVQRQLAALRATPADWIADERFDSLSFRGFYKDFSIDIAIPPVSYCTLTVEGLADDVAYADPGNDPAPIGRPSTMRLLVPAVIDDTAIVATNVPEADHASWDAETTYPIGARVIVAATHRIYESAADGNVGNDPTSSVLWIDVGPTNRWAMFDQALGSLTEGNGSITFTLDPATTIDAVALLDVSADAVRVQAAGYDQTRAPALVPGGVSFLDMPETSGPVTVTITGPGSISAGTLLVGRLLGLGITEAGPTAAITDYSRKETGNFGEVTLVERAWAKRMTARAAIDTAAIDTVMGRVANVRALPCLWIGNGSLETLTIYGFYKDFSIEVGDAISFVSLSIEGLSVAAKPAPIVETGWADIKDDDPEHPKPEDGATVGATAEQVEQWTAMHEALNLSALKVAKLLQTANAMLQARATLDGKPVGTVISEVRTIGESVVEDLKLLGARNGDGTAFNINIDTVLADGSRTLAQKFTEVEAGTEAVAASVQTLNEALVETDGTVLAKAVLSLKANGHVGGLVATNDGSTAQLDLDFDVTNLWKPDGTLLLVAGPAGEVYAPKLRVDTLVFGAMDPEFEANQSISSAQYSQKIPGGLIMKTGRYRSLIGDETSLSIVFEQPFPTECLSFVPVPNINAPSVYRDLWLQTIGNPTRFGATIQAQSSTSNNNNIDGFDWMAWGR